jgi:ribosomal protein S25
MTQREFYVTVANTETMSDEVRAYAAEAILKLDAANEKKREKAAEKRAENQPIVDKIVNEILTDVPQTTSDIAAAVGISTQKCSPILRALVAEGVATVTDVKAPKKGTCKAYAKA